jgi:hypothetical protein
MIGNTSETSPGAREFRPGATIERGPNWPSRTGDIRYAHTATVNMYMFSITAVPFLARL